MIKKTIIIISVFLIGIALVKVAKAEDWSPELTEYQNSEDYQESESFSYNSLGCYVPLPLPIFGTGYRLKEGKSAIDISTNLMSIVTINAFEVHIKGLRYINKKDYIGAGSCFGFSFGTRTYFDNNIVTYFAPVFCIGREHDDHFKEFNLRFPTFADSSANKKSKWFPAVTFRYGFKY